MNIKSCVLAYEIKKGMKSFGPIGLIKTSPNATELINKQIKVLSKILGDKVYICTGFGAEKLLRKVHSQDVIDIYNSKFLEKNHGYAIKMLLQKIKLDDSPGLFILNGDVLPKKFEPQDLDKSWVLAKKRNKKIKHQEPIGFTLKDNSNEISSMFYDIGDYVWNEAIYFCKKDWESLKNNIDDRYYDNMFMFEILNLAIQENIISLTFLKLNKNNDSVIIKKEKNKT
jgi:CTP:phosphocholine cytidylyltransferase-like protein